MGRDIRTFRQGAMVYVTNRTYHDEFRLTPGPAVNLIMCSCLLKASEQTGVRLVVGTVLGNHFELILDSPIARLDDFMEYFQKEASHRLNRMRGLEHSNFPRRYQCSELGDRRAVERKIAQILCNPVRARLVHRADDWPGFSTLAAHRRGTSNLESRHISRPNAGLLDEDAELPAWVDSCDIVSARLHRPRFAEDMTDEQWHARVVKLVEAEEARLRAELERHNERTVGRSRILNEAWHQRPDELTWTRNRRCIATNRTTADAYDTYYKNTERQYKKAAYAWRHKGAWGDYPPGTFPPGWLRCVPPSASVGPRPGWLRSAPPRDRPPPG